MTKEEIARAKELDLLTYFKLVEPSNLKLVGKEYRHKVHSSLTISKDSLWCWHCIGLRGRTALKYLIDVEKVPYVEAVREINRIQGGVVHSSQPVSLPQPRAEPEAPRDFKLPKPDANSYAAMAYLRGRCIHPNVLTFCRKEGILYQTSFKNHPNCVFVGRDGEGVAKGGSLRGCTQLQFRRDIPGSKKIYPFYIQASTKADTVEVYEAPIDAMSGASLKLMQHTGPWRNVHYLALGGTDYAALDAFLKYFPAVRKIVLCLDNDNAGRTRTQDIIAHLAGSGKAVEDRPPPVGKDYNDTLVQYMQEYRAHCMRDEDSPVFQSVCQFDTCQISLCLGGYVQAAAEPMLNAIGREALRLNRDSIAIPHEPVHNESTPTQLNSREEAIHHDVHEEPRRLPDSEPFPAEPAEPVPEPLREAASGIFGTERADALRPADAGGHAADELQPNRTDSTADGEQDPARADADHPTAGPQNEPAGLGTVDQQPEETGGGSSPSDAVRNLTESPAQAESEQSPSAFALPEFPPTLLPQLLAAETSSRASNAEYLTFYNKNPLLIDRLRFVRESYKDIFTELLLADDTRVGFHRQDNGLIVWQGAYLTRSAETLLPWRAVANALNDLIEQHELVATIDPKKLPQVEEQLSFELPETSPTSTEDDRLEKDDFLTPEKQENVIRSALPVAEYNAPQIDDGSVITDEEINLALAAGSNFENSKFRIYQQFTTTQGDHTAFLKKEYGSGGRSWDYQSGAHGWVDHGPAGLKLILTNEEGRFERRLPWRAAAKRIAYLIEMQRFLTQQELEQYPAWAAEQREAASVVRDEPRTVPESRPICAEGSVVYLEDDHRFTVECICGTRKYP